MAKKSKTQKAKASARRAEKREVVSEVVEAAEGSESTGEGATSAKKAVSTESAKQPVLSKSSTSVQKAQKEPGRIATFISGVRSELKRVTWPTRTDVIRWSGVVVGALLFFGVFVFVLDNIFPQLLVALGSINATGA